MWIDIASIVFVCVTMNHLGLIKAIEEKAGFEFTILCCPKCCTFWCVLLYSVFAYKQILIPLAIYFLASYSATWLELFEAFIDTLYLRLYDKITTKYSDYTTAADT